MKGNSELKNHLLFKLFYRLTKIKSKLISLKIVLSALFATIHTIYSTYREQEQLTKLFK